MFYKQIKVEGWMTQGGYHNGGGYGGGCGGEGCVCKWTTAMSVEQDGGSSGGGFTVYCGAHQLRRL